LQFFFNGRARFIAGGATRQWREGALIRETAAKKGSTWFFLWIFSVSRVMLAALMGC